MPELLLDVLLERLDDLLRAQAVGVHGVRDVAHHRLDLHPVRLREQLEDLLALLAVLLGEDALRGGADGHLVSLLSRSLMFVFPPSKLAAPRPSGGVAMPTYILLTTLTAQGVQTLRSNPDRLREVNRDVEELGARVLHQWATLGPFDFVNVVEAPDAQTIARVSVALGARGSAKLQTLTALTIDEFLTALD